MRNILGRSGGVRWRRLSRSRVRATTETNSVIPRMNSMVTVGAVTFPLTFAAWWILRGSMRIRGSPDEELDGLDSDQPGIEASAAFLKVAQE
jgi:ammonia channel protein AmtB